MRELLVSTLCLLALQSGCSQDWTWQATNRMIESEYPDVPSIETDSLATLLADTTSPHPLLLDVRSPEEYAVSHLPGARRVNPTADSLPSLDSLATEASIVVYCSVGYRSARFAHRLRHQGLTKVVNLRGSIFRWANEGRPVYRDGQEVTAVHPYNRTWGHLLDDSLHARLPN